MKTKFRLMVMTPRCFGDPALAIAGSRAGALGILDLGALGDPETASQALADLARLGGTHIGFRVEVNADPKVLAEFGSMVPVDAGVVVVAPELGSTFGDSLSGVASYLKKQGLNVLAEVSSLEEATAAASCEVDGLIAKGNEAGGRVEEETTFVLLQRLLEQIDLPVWARGGIGVHTAAACAAAGAEGVVLADELALVRESTLPVDTRNAISAMDGSETTVLGAELGRSLRLFVRPGNQGFERLKRLHDEMLVASDREGWRTHLREAAGRPEGSIGWRAQQAWPLGQDACFAMSLAQRFHTTGGVVAGLLAAVDEHLRTARSEMPLAPDSALARSHGTRFPVVQGPMTRVSDVAPFAFEVAEAGGLPFIALALMRAREAEKILNATQKALGDRPWGVGILGFVPRELRDEQLEVVRRFSPKFALIAGGRPDQAHALEADGIASYLHVPSPRLLEIYLEQGAKRFVFEGRECGGHVGPRSSFVLWEQMVSQLLERSNGGGLGECHILFAGGIHDARSAAMVTALAAPLAAAGAKIGVLMGTAYLFTEEAVSTGAIVRGFQEVAVSCAGTTLLETGPGHASRCAITPFAERFLNEKARLRTEGRPEDEVRYELEALNLGKLRVAAKGVDRKPGSDTNDSDSKLLALDQEQQAHEGMYMIGQVAAVVDRVVTMTELHERVSTGATEWLGETSIENVVPTEPAGPPLEVAIVGMSCLLPGAPDLPTFWDNVLNGVEAITEVPPERWDWKQYFDEDQSARDKVYSRWGGFLAEIPFNPLAYGMPPTTLSSVEPLQLLTLEVIRAALADAGLLDRDFPRQRASIILGAGGGVADLGNRYAVRATLPTVADNVPSEIWDRLPEWTEDSFAGLLLNVAAGRAANRFDFGGLNLTVDAACASSLAAIYVAAQELADGRSDLVLAGGIDTAQNPFGYLCFSKTHALSPRGKSSVFDSSADGIVISEGLAVVVMKRLADAERDGDRIYAVLQGVGGSSDGRGRSMTAPRPGGQMRALERAYQQAGYSPATVGLVEAHGTGTAAGDLAETETLRRVWEEAGAKPSSTAVGSVKSMIGHTKCAAGVTGMVKTALALHRKVLPATLNVERPNPKAGFGEGPIYVNSELRPWLAGAGDHPRRAGVSAFGFGGTNFHVTLEEYTGDPPTLPQPATGETWPTELLVFRGNRNDVVAQLDHLRSELAAGAQPALRDLALSCWDKARRHPARVTAAVVAADLESLADRLSSLREAVANNTPLSDPSGAWYSAQPLAQENKVAFLFPGQGSQYPDMARDLAIHFRSFREEIEKTERALAGVLEQPLGTYLYPPPSFTPDEKKLRAAEIKNTRVAQPALGAVALAGVDLLAQLGVVPEMAAGHSYGEFSALAAAGVISKDDLPRISEARGRLIIEAATRDLGTMAAIAADAGQVAEAIAGLPDVWIANHNSPRQTVLSGTEKSLAVAIERLREKGFSAQQVHVACGFHSPLVAAARDMVAEMLTDVPMAPPALPVYSNSTAGEYPENPKDIQELLSDHLVNPVRFEEEIKAMFEAGARVFVEVGPRAVLTGLTEQILEGQPIVALSLDRPDRHGLTQLQHLLGALAAQGVEVDLDPLFAGRRARVLQLDRLQQETEEQPYPSSTWMVHGGGIRPLGEEATPQKPFSLASPAPSAATSGPTTRAADKPPVPAKAASVSSDPPPIRQAAISGEVEQVLLEFQASMQQMVESQERVMLAFLGAPSDGTSTAHVDRSLTATATASPVDPIQPGAEPPPVPTIQLETQSTVADDPIAATPALAAEKTVGLPGIAEISRMLIEIVVERTGYPIDLVDPEASLEADLGIDSIKRVEILGELQRLLPDGLEQHLSGVMEELTGAPSVSEIAAHIVDAFSAVDTVPAEVASTGGETSTAAETVHVPSEVELRDLLIKIVVDRTGYPADLVDPEASLEADLGIDSIKRVEILGELQRSLPDGLEQHLNSVMEELTAAPGVSEIAALIAGALATGHATGSDPKAGPAATDSVERPSDAKTPVGTELPRFEMTSIPVDIPPNGSLPAGTVLITDDGRGVAQHLASVLRTHGTNAVVIDGADFDPEHGAPSLNEALAATEQLIGIVHLQPLAAKASFAEDTVADWRLRLRHETGGLFHFVKTAVPSFNGQSAHVGRPRVIATTALGGDFALGKRSEPENFPPAHGAICGFMKTLAVESPELAVKVVDLDLREEAEKLADQLYFELATDDGEVEVGWRHDQRWVPRPAPLRGDAEGSPLLDSQSVVLLTGGARGITAEIAIELAEQFQSTLVLVGRTPMPEAEGTETAGLLDAKEIKAALIAERKRLGVGIVLSEVEADYHRLLVNREMSATFERLETAGSNWLYLSGDMRNPAEVARILTEIRTRFGRLDAALHGAGLIEDKLIKDKTWDSFERVLETKAVSSYLLARELTEFLDTLRFVSFFSSVAGTFPNRGQADYTAGNEVMNKLALLLTNSWSKASCKVVALCWGPWEKGMAGDAVQQQFRSRGVEPITVSEGRQALVRELATAAGSPVVVLGRGPWEQLGHASSAEDAAHSGESENPTPAPSTTSEGENLPNRREHA